MTDPTRECSKQRRSQQAPPFSTYLENVTLYMCSTSTLSAPVPGVGLQGNLPMGRPRDGGLERFKVNLLLQRSQPPSRGRVCKGALPAVTAVARPVSSFPPRPARAVRPCRLLSWAVHRGTQRTWAPCSEPCSRDRTRSSLPRWTSRLP